MKELIFISALFFCTTIFAQENSLAISGGLVEKQSYGAMINYTYSSNNSNYEIGIIHSMFNQELSNDSEKINVNFTNTTLNLGYLHTLIRSRDNSISINGGGGVFGGFEHIPKNSQVVILNKSGLIYGIYVAANLDFYTSDNFAFTIRAQENYNVNSTSGDFNPFLSFGLKFNF